MVIRPSSELIDAVKHYARAVGTADEPIEFDQPIDGHSVRLPAFIFGGRLLVLAEQEAGATFPDVAKLFASSRPEVFNKPGLREAIIGIGAVGSGGFPPQLIALGIQAMPWHAALAHVIGMPEGWRDGQEIS